MCIGYSMRKGKMQLLILFFVGILVFAGCASDNPNDITFSDWWAGIEYGGGMPLPPMPAHDPAGYEIHVPENITGIVSLGAFNIEMANRFYIYDKVVSTTYDVDLILSLNPDIVFAAHKVHDLSRVVDAGITVAYIPERDNMIDMAADVLFKSRVLDIWWRGVSLFRETEMQIEFLHSITQQAVTRLNAGNPLLPVHVTICINAETDAITLPALLNLLHFINMEQVDISYNPYAVLIVCNVCCTGHITDIAQFPDWQTLDAVYNNRLFGIDLNHFNEPLHGSILLLMEIVTSVFPHL